MFIETILVWTFIAVAAAGIGFYLWLMAMLVWDIARSCEEP